MRTLLAVAALSATLSAQMTAIVSDPKSHGQLNDGLLSLDEAIRVMNTTLSYSSLSAAEQAQFRGMPTTILDTIEIDFNVTPVITVEQKLTEVIGDTVAHVDCNFFGINGRPVIDATGVNPTEIFPSRTNHFHLRDIIVRGGQIAISYDTLLHYHPGELFWVRNCLFEGQSKKAIEVRVPAFPPGGIQPGEIFDTVFRGLPTAIEFMDQGFAGDTDMRISNTRFESCGEALRFTMGGTVGAVDVVVDRCAIVGATTGIVATRTVATDSTLTLDVEHTTIAASGSAIDLAGDTIGAGVVTVRHSDLRGGPGTGDFALRTTPSGARFNMTVSETQVDGNVLLQLGSRASVLSLHNNRFANGQVVLRTTGPGGDLADNAHTSAPLMIDAATTKSVRADRCDFVRSDITDATAAGVTTLASAFLGSSTASANVQVQSLASQPWIGSAWVTPTAATLGGSVDLAVDLQPGTAAVWMVGLSTTRPSVALPPWTLYLDLAKPTVTLPALLSAQASLRVPLPNNQSLSGIELYAMPLLVPTTAQSPAPVFHVMRGGRFVAR